MKRGKKLLVLLLALVVLAGAWFLVRYMSNKSLEDPVLEDEAGDIDLSAGEAEDITALSWTYLDESVSLVYDEEAEAWVDADDETCPIDEEAVEALVEAISSVTATTEITDVEDWEQYGLDDPSVTVTATTADHSVTYSVGAINSLTGEYYVQIEGEDTVYTETGWLSSFQIDIYDLLAMETVPSDISEVISLTVDTDVESYELTTQPGTVEARYGTGYEWFRPDADTGTYTPLITEQAQAMYGLVTTISFLSCETWNAQDLSVYGLDDPQGTATVDYLDTDGEEQTFTIEFGDYVGSYVYVRLAGSDMVYLATGTTLDALMYPDWASMTPLDVCPIDVEGVSRISITLDGITYDIDRILDTTVETVTEDTEDAEEAEAEDAEAAEDSGAEEETEAETAETVTVLYSYNGWVLDTDDMDSWLASLTSLSAESLADDQEGREELMQVTFYMSDDDAQEGSQTEDEEGSSEEVQTTASGLEVTMWSYNSTSSLCVVSDGSSYFVSRTTIEDLISDIQGILEVEEDTEG